MVRNQLYLYCFRVRWFRTSHTECIRRLGRCRCTFLSDTFHIHLTSHWRSHPGSNLSIQSKFQYCNLWFPRWFSWMIQIKISIVRMLHVSYWKFFFLRTENWCHSIYQDIRFSSPYSRQILNSPVVFISIRPKESSKGLSIAITKSREVWYKNLN